MVKLDIGCGKNKREGFIGIDQFPMEGVDIVMDVRNEKLPYDDCSVDEVYASHFLEHLTATERVHLLNEAYRVLKHGGVMTVATPHWASNRAYGDFTHQWPPVSEMFYYYLSKKWRDVNAPHTDIEYNPEGYACDFHATWGYSYNPELNARHPEHVQFALANYKEVIMDMVATLTKPSLIED
jgi:SAM-dependent methyltransferase